ALATPTGHAPDGWAKLDGLSYVEAALWIAAQLADGLSHAHGCGILHRDLKPANVLLTDEGRPMLLDFNLADDVKVRTADEAAGGGRLSYMAPGHLRACRTKSGRLDQRCDISSLGVILYELLTGRRPFRTPTTPALDADRPPPPPVRGWNPAVSPAAE